MKTFMGFPCDFHVTDFHCIFIHWNSHGFHGISMLLIFTAFSYTGIHMAFMGF